MTVELWTTGIAHADWAPRAAARAEAAGWDGMVVVDSQNLSGTTAFWHVDDIEASVKAVLDADRQRGDSSSAAPAVAISP